MTQWTPAEKVINITAAEISKINRATIWEVVMGEKICGHFNKTREETIFILTGGALLKTVDFSSDNLSSVPRNAKLLAPCRIIIPYLVAHQLTFLSPSSYYISWDRPADPDDVFALRL